jgi:mannose-6-phosphate isomerase
MKSSTAIVTENILPLAPNRVWRTALGGKTLDQIEKQSEAKDSHFSEDWLASTTRAINANREDIIEGISSVIVNGEKKSLLQLLETDPIYFLGKKHVETFGLQLMFLAKLLDSAVRLSIQVHPTISFSQKHLNANSGKTEIYHILKIREDNPQPYIFMGFQNPPSPEKFKKMVEIQDHTQMEACFEKIPICVGDTFYIPGGIPHAIGEGVLMVEVMEPTDFCARFDYQKPEYVIPEAGRFLGRDIDFAMSMMNFDRISQEDVLTNYRIRPSIEKTFNDGSSRESLIGKPLTHVFRIKKLKVRTNVQISDDSFCVSIVIKGHGEIKAGGSKWTCNPFDRFFIPAGLSSYEISSTEGIELLQCFPPEIDT